MKSFKEVKGEDDHQNLSVSGDTQSCKTAGSQQMSLLCWEINRGLQRGSHL